MLLLPNEGTKVSPQLWYPNVVVRIRLLLYLVTTQQRMHSTECGVILH